MEEQWRRVSSTCNRHWRRVGSGAAARKSDKQGVLERFPPLFSSLPVVAGWQPSLLAEEEKKRKTFGFNFLSFLDLLSVFPCFKFVSSADLFLFFLFHLLLCFRWQQDQGGCRLLGSGFPSGLCSCRWPVRVLAKTRACGLLPLGWRGRSKSG